MRVPGLLGGSLLLASVLCAASDQPGSPEFNSDVVPARQMEFTSVPQAERGAVPRNRARLRRKLMAQENSVCYTMRTYIMVRENGDSDVTRRDGYVSCQPAWKFEVRSAVAVPEEP